MKTKISTFFAAIAKTILAGLIIGMLLILLLVIVFYTNIDTSLKILVVISLLLLSEVLWIWGRK
jgi:uncharacterized RDD family membrane protein YckC